MRFVLPFVALAFAACAMEDSEAVHDEPEDYVVDPADGKADGVPAVFDANNVLSDEVMTGGEQMTADEIQQFLESTPYRNRSWLASYQEDGVSAAQMIADAAQAHDVNALVILARMQVEQSLVSKTAKPSTRSINKALGCGCPDGAACNPAYSGLRKQVDCGARTFRRWYDGSIDGSGQWRKGTQRSTLDPRRVTPANHATASYYAYTPWVLVGSGGNWLAWNVTRKYLRHAEANGLVDVQ